MLGPIAAIALAAWQATDLPALPIPAPAVAEAAAPPAGPGLTAEGLEALALRANPTIAQAVDRFEQARGRALQAGAYPNPLVIWNASSLGNEGTVGNQQGFLQQPIVTGGKLRVNRARYEVDVEAARWGVAQQQIIVRNGVRVRYYQVLAQQEQLALRGRLIAMAEGVVDEVRRKVDSGHASEPDLLMAENVALQAALDRDQLLERYRNTWREFAAYLGCPQMPPAPLAGRLEGELADYGWEPLLDRLLRESPEMRVAELQVRREELTLDRELREPIPDLVVRGGGGHDPSSGQTTGYARVYLEVPLWDRNQGNIRTARGGLSEVRRDVARVRFNLQQRLARDFNHYQTSLANLRRYRDALLPRAYRAFELYFDSFKDEDASYSRVQSSQTAYAEASLKYIEELLELRRAEVALIGYDLVEETIEGGTLRPPGSGGLSRPGQGLGHAAAGGGVPVGRPSRGESP